MPIGPMGPGMPMGCIIGPLPIIGWPIMGPPMPIMPICPNGMPCIPIDIMPGPLWKGPACKAVGASVSVLITSVNCRRGAAGTVEHVLGL